MVQLGRGTGAERTPRRRDRRESQRDQRRRSVAMKRLRLRFSSRRSLLLCVGNARRCCGRRVLLLETQNTPMNALAQHLFVKIRSHGHWVRWFRWCNVAIGRAASRGRGEESAEKVNAINVGALLR